MNKEKLIQYLLEKISYYEKRHVEAWKSNEDNKLDMSAFYHGCYSSLNDLLLEVLKEEEK